MRETSVGANLTAATLTTLYTVPTGYYAKLVTVLATNASGSNKHITLDWYDASTAATYSFVYQYTVASKTYLSLNDSSYITLEEGDIIKATSEAGSTFAVAITLEVEGSQRA